MEFSEKLKYCRNKKKMTQQEVADELGVTARTYQNYEAGKAFPQQSKVYMALSRLFGVSVDYLLFREITVPDQGEEVTDLASSLREYFTDKDLPESERDGMYKYITNLYWEGKNLK